MKFFGADVILNVDYDNNSRFWTQSLTSETSVKEQLSSHLKDFCPVIGYQIDSIDRENNLIYCTLEKYNKKAGSSYWQTQLYISSQKIDIDNSFIFSKAIRVRGDWDEIHDLQKQIADGYTQVNTSAEKNYKDIATAYKSLHKQYNKEVSKDLKETIQRLAKLKQIQDTYVAFIDLRKQSTSKQNQISTASGKEYSDVTKAFSSFVGSYDQSISADLRTCFDRLNALIAIEDSCLKFIDLRKQITALNGQITGNKTCKNLTKIYSNYLKTADLSWSQDATANGKLLKVINVQQQVLSIISKPDAKEKDTQVKKMKGLTLEEIIKKLQ